MKEIETIALSGHLFVFSLLGLPERQFGNNVVKCYSVCKKRRNIYIFWEFGLTCPRRRAARTRRRPPW